MNEELRLHLIQLEKDLDSIVASLGWTKEEFQRPKMIKNQLPDNNSDCYQGRIPSTFVDQKRQADIILNSFIQNPTMKLSAPVNQLSFRGIPQTYTDTVVNFSREERLELYKHAITETGHCQEPEVKITINNDDNVKREMTFAEILAHNRNLKRRRMKHRTTKEVPLSHKEEIRKLIGTQMESFEQFLCKSRVSQSGRGEILWHKQAPSMDVKDRKLQSESDHRARSQSRHKQRKHKRSRSRSKSRKRRKRSRDNLKDKNSRRRRTSRSR